jgi:hypothetical protein
MKDDDEKVISKPVLTPVTLPPATPSPFTLKSSIHPTSRLAPPFQPFDQLEAVKDSDRMLGAVARGKLSVIAEQIRHLQGEALKIIEQARNDMELHRVACSFEKRVGHVYHLYERDEDNLYFSLLSPNDWRGCPPHNFVGSYKLESDMTWTKLEE